MSTYRQLSPGEPAPWFRQRSTSNPSYVFDTVAGRYIVLCFFGSVRDQQGHAALAFATTMQRALFDDTRVSFFGVSVDPEDESSERVRESIPGIRHFWDFDGKVSRLYGALPIASDQQALNLRRLWVVLDPGLHVLSVLPMQADGSDRATLLQLLNGLPPIERYAGFEMHAPVIILPNVFEPELCQRLIGEYNIHGGQISGVMQEIDGKTVGVHNSRHKRRDDHVIEDQPLRKLLQQRVQQKVAPLIRKAYCFEATRMERYIVGCYDSENSGHFQAHRDNTTKGTAHRRFALSLNLNDDFEGGELCFPEYGPRSYKMPAGSAVIFSGVLLHAVSPVRKGKRYAFLPFLYDEAAAAVREANNPHLAESVGAYRA
jgi:predicted 2-oxoglutarate/Fe(II)-dependent dioxygenase YbiX/peroxiredoxin